MIIPLFEMVSLGTLYPGDEGRFFLDDRNINWDKMQLFLGEHNVIVPPKKVCFL